MTERMFDHTHVYELVALQDGCMAIHDVTLGEHAHGTTEGDFRRWSEDDSTQTWSFGPDDEGTTLNHDVAPVPLYTPPTPEAAERSELDALWDALGAEANRRGWCEEYDEFASKHGGPARPPRRYNYTLPFRINLDVNLAESDAPREQWDALSNFERREAVKIAISRRMQNAIDSYGLSLTDSARDVLVESISRYVAINRAGIDG